MNQVFVCICRNPLWTVRQVSPLGGIVECNYCETVIRFTVDTIEYSI